jgi:putative transposase
MASIRSWLLATAKDRHRPPHHLTEGHAIFITASTDCRIPHLSSDDRRTEFARLMIERFEAARIELLAWVLLKEHYHLIAIPQDPAILPQTIQKLHGDSAREWNVEDRTSGRACWYQYWDTTLWTEDDLASRVNYIHRNPVKHGYVTNAEDWEWSTYREYLKTLDIEDTGSPLKRFPAPLRIPKDDF